MLFNFRQDLPHQGSGYIESNLRYFMYCDVEGNLKHYFIFKKINKNFLKQGIVRNPDGTAEVHLPQSFKPKNTGTEDFNYDYEKNSKNLYEYGSSDKKKVIYIFV